MAAPPPTLPEATTYFAWLARGAPNDTDWLGVRTERMPAGKDRIRMTIVPFAGDVELAVLAAEAQVEAWPLHAQVYTGDPDEDLEEMLDQRNRRVGAWIVNPYENVIVNTFHPECTITDAIAVRAPRLHALLEHVERRYLPYQRLAAWFDRDTTRA